VTLGECGIILDGRNRPHRVGGFTAEEQHRVYKNLGLVT